MITIKILTSHDMVIAQRITANGFGRIDKKHVGWELTIFPEYAILEKLFTVTKFF